MNGGRDPESEDSEFVEVDPSGRYGKYNEILGKGASKIVYRAFDEYEGVEVAWNQVKLSDFLKSPGDLERLYREIHLLKTLKHPNIMKFYTSWVDTDNRNINFVTEMFTSGTLRQYREKHKRVNIRAVKHWCRQVLEGLLYLHSHDPPVIHRDLKCDNIFVNGNQGEVKIGDLGLAAILRKSHAARCVGTPEFMAPEVYEEEYNELVDIYSFGMCILEMVTFDYPYSECTHSAQIYKKVISGKKPDALYKVKDPEVRRFVEKCLATASLRFSAGELLQDPFLQNENYRPDLKPLQYWGDATESVPNFRHLSPYLINGYSNYHGYVPMNGMDSHPLEYQTSDNDLFTCHDNEHLENVITIKGKKREDDGILLRLRLADEEGRIRNIYFPFDIETDTALSVATEMVSELDITDQDVTKISDMIDAEIAALVPDWKRGAGIDEISHYTTDSNFCHHCASSVPFLDYVTSNNLSTRNLQVLQCSRQGCAAVHGRFQEITIQVEESEQYITENDPAASRQSNSIHYTDIWAQQDGPELSSHEYKDSHSDTAQELESNLAKDERDKTTETKGKPNSRHSYSVISLAASAFSDDCENEIRQELRWLKAKYQLQLRELRDHQMGIKSKSAYVTQNSNGTEDFILKSVAAGKHFTSCFPTDGDQMCHSLSNQRLKSRKAANGCPEQMIAARSVYSAALLPNSLQRATSLPVDAVDC